MTETSESNGLLVVDDDLSFVTFVCAALEKLGVESEVALTGGDAIRRTRSGAYSGVLLDLKLPDISGLEVLRDIRQHTAELPVIVLTGAGTVAAAVEAMKLGAGDFVEKPVSSATLSHAVRTLFFVDKPGGPWAAGPNRLIDQLARGMNAVVQCPTDVPTVRAWCSLIGKSESSHYALCEMVGVQAKAALDLARLLRAARFSDVGGFRSAIDAADPRTTVKLFRRAGISAGVVPARLAADILGHQQLISDPRIIERLAHYARVHPGSSQKSASLEKIP